MRLIFFAICVIMKPYVKKGGVDLYSKAYVEITNICNRNCSFCPGTKRAPMRMSLEDFDTVTQKLKGVTDYLYLHVMGEPLTHPQLIPMIALASDRGYHVAITTNGTLLDKVGPSLISSGVYKVNISLHSFEEGSKEDYLYYINSCIDFADAASMAGILVVFRLWNAGYDKGRNIDTVALLREKLSGDWKEGSRGIRIRKGLHLEYGDRFEWPDIAAEDRGEKVFCYGLRDQFAVLCDGRVVPCCLDREGEMTLGNILEENADINEILGSERAVNIKNGFSCRKAAEELCRKCGYAQRFNK